MNRDDARDLLPLYAGGDLDDDAHAAVAALLADDAELTEECSAWEELDTMLTDALTPADAAEPDWAALLAEPESGGAEVQRREAVRSARDFGSVSPPGAAAPQGHQPRSPAPVVVRRHCPFCKDDLPAEAVVFCGTCATPHHEPCFAENQGCSLLGCGGTESVTLDSARRQVCATCSRTTPADAPFCAWCGASAQGVERPRHEQVIALPAPSTWRPLLTAAALLLSMGLGVGGLFGLQQGALVQSLQKTMQQAGYAPEWDDTERLGRLYLAELRAAQRIYRDKDLDGNGVADPAPSLAALTRVVRARAAGVGADPKQLLHLPSEEWKVVYRVDAGGRFAVLLLMKPRYVGGDAMFFARPVLLDRSGKIRIVPRATGLGPDLAPTLEGGAR